MMLLIASINNNVAALSANITLLLEYCTADANHLSWYFFLNKQARSSQCGDSRSLEAKVTLEILGDLTNKTLEGELADEQVGGLLVTTDLTESDGTGSESVGLLDTTGSGGGEVPRTSTIEVGKRDNKDGKWKKHLVCSYLDRQLQANSHRTQYALQLTPSQTHLW